MGWQRACEACRAGRAERALWLGCQRGGLGPHEEQLVPQPQRRRPARAAAAPPAGSARPPAPAQLSPTTPLPAAPAAAAPPPVHPAPQARSPSAQLAWWDSLDEFKALTDALKAQQSTILLASFWVGIK